MIYNEKQYHSTKKNLKGLKDVLVENYNNYQEGDYMALLEIKGEESMIRKLEAEIQEYEGLKNGTLTTVTLDMLGHIPELLIKARIAKNWTQADLAKKVMLKEQQIQKYESTDYAGASTWKLLFIMDALEISTPPIKVQIAKPRFEIGEWSKEKLEQAQQGLSERKVLCA